MYKLIYTKYCNYRKIIFDYIWDWDFGTIQISEENTKEK